MIFESNSKKDEIIEEKGLNYLYFSEDEKKEILEKIDKIRKSKGFNFSEKEFNLPKGLEELEDLIVQHPILFDTKRLLEVALKNSEYAPSLTVEILKRENYSALEKILKEYKKNDVIFNKCVSLIELTLKDNKPLQERILIMLAKKLEENEEGNRVAFERFSSFMFEKPEKASRSLDTYLRFLKIDKERAKELLDKKRLLLIGGGIAPIKKDLLGRGIDCHITNIEPLLRENNRDNSDVPVLKNFYDIDIEHFEEYEEVWSANNSLPTYAFNPDQVRIFYQKALKFIKKNGILRIVPYCGFSDSITPSMRLNRIPTNNESIRIVNLFKEREDLFEVEEFKTPEIRSFSGKKKVMKGVNIKAIGDKNEIKAFLENI